MNGRVRRPVPSAGLDLALAAGRLRRRRAKVTGAALLSAVAVTFGGVVVQAGQRGDGMGVDTLDGPQAGTPSVTVTPDPGGGSGPATADPTETPSPRGQVVPDETTPTPAPPPTATPRRPDPGPVMHGPDVTTDQSICDNVPVFGIYCTIARAPKTMKAGQPVTLAMWVCRHSGLLSETVSYPTRQEGEFVVRSGDMGHVWRWSRGYDFPAQPHTRTFDGGHCYRWTVDWNGVDAAGRPLPPGTYYLEVRPTAEEWFDASPQDAKLAGFTFEITR